MLNNNETPSKLQRDGLLQLGADYIAKTKRTGHKKAMIGLQHSIINGTETEKHKCCLMKFCPKEIILQNG